MTAEPEADDEKRGTDEPDEPEELDVRPRYQLSGRHDQPVPRATRWWLMTQGMVAALAIMVLGAAMFFVVVSADARVPILATLIPSVTALLTFVLRDHTRT